MAQRKMQEAEAEVEARKWETEIPTLLFKRSIKNLNLSDFSYNKRISGLIRLRERK